jgi:glycosyltransferase involved in cell wall biosynthesis
LNKEKSKSKPLVSVIIPVYNCERYLAQAIEGVLAQTYHPVEVIVLDDGSTDNSATVAKSFDSSVRYCYQKNSGCAAARNRGIKLARGTFLAFLDADDLWLEDKLMLQMDAFKEAPELDIVFGQVKQFHSPEVDESVKAKIHCPSELMPGLIPSTVLIRRDVFFRVGLFNTNLKSAEFADWYLRATELRLKVKIVSDLVTRRRLHNANMGIINRQHRNDFALALKASLDRRRAIRKTEENN